MSASPFPRRNDPFTSDAKIYAQDDPSDSNREGWIGIDLTGKNDPRRAGALVPLLILVLVTALGIAALRIDLIRVRYAVAAAMETEAALIDEQRALTARRRQFRDPVALATQASERGFRSPARTFVIPDPVGAVRLPSVAAGFPVLAAEPEPSAPDPGIRRAPEPQP